MSAGTIPNPAVWAPVDRTPGMWRRDARPGETCTCGQPARLVWLTGGVEVGYCGVPDGHAPEEAAAAPVMPPGITIDDDEWDGYASPVPSPGQLNHGDASRVPPS